MKLTRDDVKQFLRERSPSPYYGDILRKFVREAGGELGEATVRKFAGGYQRRSSSNTVLAVLKSIAKWKMGKIPPIGEERLLQRFELEQIAGIRGTRTVTRLTRKELSDEELAAIFESTKGTEFSGLWCLAWFGPRPGELLALTPELINKRPDRYLPPELARSLGPDDYCVKFVTEKTKVERAVFMDGFTKGHLERFIEGGCSYQRLRRACLRLQRRVGVRFTPKWFRSTFQTKMQRRLLEAGTPMVRLDLLVKVMSGHTVSGDITSIYTDYGRDIKRAMTELHYLKGFEEELQSK